MKNKKSLCFISTVEFTVNAFLVSHLKNLSKNYNITVVTKLQNKNFFDDKKLNISTKNINFSRKINLCNDLICLVRMIYFFRKEKFDAVCSITPKAGLLGMLASYFCFVPMRVHCFTGQIWITKVGIKRYFFKFIDQLINILSTHNIVDSKSQFDFLLIESVINKKSFVFGSGSINGVDLDKFKPNLRERYNLRKKLNISKSTFVILFLGRLNKDKGVYDLIKAFNRVNIDSACLLFVGPDEEKVNENFKNMKNILFYGPTSFPQKFLMSSDVLCLPSYREGFGNVIIEAAATGIPSIASNIYGLTDAIVPNETGLLHKVGDIDGIAGLIKLIFTNKKLSKELGKKAKKRAEIEFDTKILVRHWEAFFKKELSRL